MHGWLGLLLALLVPGGCLLLAGYAVQKLAARQADPALAIVPPVKKFAGFDPALRDRTAARRNAAQQIRSRAAVLESGSKPASDRVTAFPRGRGTQGA